jgi:hypothetical protein
VNRLACSISSLVRDLDTPRILAVRYGVAKRLSTLIAWVISVHYKAWAPGINSTTCPKLNRHKPDIVVSLISTLLTGQRWGAVTDRHLIL